MADPGLHQFAYATRRGLFRDVSVLTRRRADTHCAATEFLGHEQDQRAPAAADVEQCFAAAHAEPVRDEAELGALRLCQGVVRGGVERGAVLAQRIQELAEDIRIQVVVLVGVGDAGPRPGRLFDGGHAAASRNARSTTATTSFNVDRPKTSWSSSSMS